MGELPATHNDLWPIEWQIFQKPETFGAGQRDNGFAHLNLWQFIHLLQQFGIELRINLSADLNMRHTEGGLRPWPFPYRIFPVLSLCWLRAQKQRRCEND